MFLGTGRELALFSPVICQVNPGFDVTKMMELELEVI